MFNPYIIEDVNRRITGHGPTLLAGLPQHLDLRLVDQTAVCPDAVAMRYEPKR